MNKQNNIYKVYMNKQIHIHNQLNLFQQTHIHNQFDLFQQRNMNK